MNYKKPKRMFEDSGTVDPKMSYHVELENVTNEPLAETHVTTLHSLYIV